MPLRALITLMILTPLAKVPANAPHPSIVAETRAAINRGDFAAAETRLAAYRTAEGVTPRYLEALSWMGRGHLAAKQFDEAERYAAETRKLVLEALKQRSLDDDSSLALALGASIEVHGLALNARGQKSEAVAFLQDELRTWRETSVRTRIQKNLHLISLEGRRAPVLDVSEFLGTRPQTLGQLRGKPVLLFFWAHWCADCKAEAAVLRRIMTEFGGSGLTLVGPTQRYGYGAGGADAARDVETKYIDEVRQKYYGGLDGMAVPLSEENFKQWGASTTPTLALIDRTGVVRLYRPGRIGYEELAPLVQRVVNP